MRIALAIAVLISSIPAHAENNALATLIGGLGGGESAVRDLTPSSRAPRIYAEDGTYLGRLCGDRADTDCIVNPHGRYGDRTSADSILNPRGSYGLTRKDKERIIHALSQ